MSYKVISFYRYTEISTPEVLRDILKSEGLKLKILGRILLAKEGINGAVSGKISKIELFKTILLNYFSQLTFREQNYLQNSYHKLVVRVRKEICAFNTAVNVANTGHYLSPEELKEGYDHQEEFYLVDARNDCESKVGKFKKAITLPIKNFREFPLASKQLNSLKEKKIVLYCTGGIRCEKASAYLKEQGFTDVNQLKGGIINYVNTFPENNEWQGGLFVFDDRLVSDVGGTITACQFCNKKSKQYTNCNNLDCDKLFIACESCLKENDYSCSKECTQSGRRRKNLEQPQEIIGIVENYYPKVKVALVRVTDELKTAVKVSFSGKTTGKTTPSFIQKIAEIRDDGGRVIEMAQENQLITFLVKEKVRRNDKVVLA